MKWHCGVCLYIYKSVTLALKSNKCPVLLPHKSMREGSQASICCEPVDESTQSQQNEKSTPNGVLSFCW